MTEKNELNQLSEHKTPEKPQFSYLRQVFTNRLIIGACAATVALPIIVGTITACGFDGRIELRLAGDWFHVIVDTRSFPEAPK